MIDEKLLHIAARAYRAAGAGYADIISLQNAIETYEAAKEPVSLDQMKIIYCKGTHDKYMLSYEVAGLIAVLNALGIPYVE